MNGLHCNCAGGCWVTSCSMCGAEIAEQDRRATQHNLCLPCKGSRIPAHCPYKAGDRVVMQASPLAGRYHPQDPIRTGFRGVVEGTVGAKLLIGLRDDGLGWCESWGSLDREPATEQLGLFDDDAPFAGRRARLRRNAGRRTAAAAVPGGLL